MERIERDCVISGGGPAGIMAGYLLARAGLRVTVLEKHADFFRDFRGDTIHPSTISVLGELGLRERFLELPLSRISTMDVVIDGHRLTLVDFATLPSPDNFLVFAPQWDFLDFLATEGARFPGFDLRMETAAEELLTENGVVTGIRARGPDGLVEVTATLTVAADGRDSLVRDAAGLIPIDVGAPIDVLWFSLPMPSPPPPVTLAYTDSRGIVLTLDRGDHYQGGLVIAKAGFDEVKGRGIASLRDRVAAIAPPVARVVDTLTSWEQVKVLSVRLNRLDDWHRPGLICIGDAAHAMSPVGGVGVNYAIQDAVALANALVEPLRRGEAPDTALASVQARRTPPVLTMQRIQRLAHARISRPSHSGTRAIPVLARVAITALRPIVARITARVIGRGFLPEHVSVSGLADEP